MTTARATTTDMHPDFLGIPGPVPTRLPDGAPAESSARSAILVPFGTSRPETGSMSHSQVPSRHVSYGGSSPGSALASSTVTRRPFRCFESTHCGPIRRSQPAKESPRSTPPYLRRSRSSSRWPERSSRTCSRTSLRRSFSQVRLLFSRNRSAWDGVSPLKVFPDSFAFACPVLMASMNREASLFVAGGGPSYLSRRRYASCFSVGSPYMASILSASNLIASSILGA